MNKQVENLLIPYFGKNFPEKAEKEAFKRMEKGGKIYLLHITDTGPMKSVRYMTGQLGEDNELVSTSLKSLRELQERQAKKHVEEFRDEAAKHGISVQGEYVMGTPSSEVLEAIEKYSIDIVLVEKLREEMFEFFSGDEIELLKKKAPCRVIIVT